MRGNPSGNLVPECEPRLKTGVKLEAYDIGCHKLLRGFSTQLRHSVTCPRSIFYTRTPPGAQAENQKSYVECTAVSRQLSAVRKIQPFVCFPGFHSASLLSLDRISRQITDAIPRFPALLTPYNDQGVNMISVVQVGSVGYAEGLRLQQKLVELRKACQIGDVVLLLEHTPVITLGRNARAANVLASTEQLAARGVEVFECDRGGDVTFHGPGQIVGYPIVDLRGYSRQPSALSSQLSAPTFQEEQGAKLSSLPAGRSTLGAVDYVRWLEDVLIRTCADFGIPTKPVAGLTGVWTEAAGMGSGLRPNQGGSETRHHTGTEAKIAAIGVHISRSVTSHGFALNVNTDLSFFNLIVPCGITAKPVTSMKKELGREVDIDAVTHSLSRNFGSVFERQMRWVESLDTLLGQSVGVPLKPPEELRRVRGEDDVFLA